MTGHLKGGKASWDCPLISSKFAQTTNWMICILFRYNSTLQRHGTARLHLSFYRAALKIGTGPSTAESLHLRKSCHGTANIEVPRPTYLVVLGTATNLGTGAKPAPFTRSELAVPCRKKAAPVPKYSPCRAQNVIV